jgi:TetR/AcrR family transcriptional regulator, repressor of fatR-cypB operon
MDTPLWFLVSDADPPAKRAILTTALTMFATGGVDSISIREIAASAGFSNPAMFRHFRSKEDLASSLFEACYRRLTTLGAAGSDAPLAARLKDWLTAIETSPEAVHFVLENMRRYWPRLPEELRVTSLLATMRRLIEAEQRAGRVRRDVDAQVAAALVLGLLSQIARMAHFNELPKPPSQMAGTLWDLLDRGLGK